MKTYREYGSHIKVSELIQELQKQQAEHGDLDVVIRVGFTGGYMGEYNCTEEASPWIIGEEDGEMIIEGGA